MKGTTNATQKKFADYLTKQEQQNAQSNQRQKKAGSTVSRNHAIKKSAYGLGSGVRQEELPLSTEMIDILHHSIYNTDDFGLLDENVASRTTMPLDAAAVFFPTAHVLQSATVAPVSPRHHSRTTHNNALAAYTNSSIGNVNPNTRNSMSAPTDGLQGSLGIFGDSADYAVGLSPGRSSHLLAASFSADSTYEPHQLHRSTAVASTSSPMFKHVATDGSEAPALSAVDNRLQILWLQRQAQLQRDSGDFSAAYNTLEHAVNRHLFGTEQSPPSTSSLDGTDTNVMARDYMSANLSAPTMSSNPRDILQAIQNTFVAYDPLAHRMASRIQMFYHKFYVAKCAHVTAISKVFRGHRVRRRMRQIRAIRDQCAKLLQRQYRHHLRLLHRRARQLQQWYRLYQNFVRPYRRRLFLHVHARRLQCWWRQILANRRIAYLRYRLQCIHRLQRNIRGYLVRADIAYQLSRVHKMYFVAAVTIQRAVRFHFLSKRRMVWQLIRTLLSEFVRSQLEDIVCADVAQVARYLSTASHKDDNQHFYHRLLHPHQYHPFLSPVFYCLQSSYHQSKNKIMGDRPLLSIPRTLTSVLRGHLSAGSESYASTSRSVNSSMMQLTAWAGNVWCQRHLRRLRARALLTQRRYLRLQVAAMLSAETGDTNPGTMPQVRRCSQDAYVVGASSHGKCSTCNWPSLILII